MNVDLNRHCIWLSLCFDKSIISSFFFWIVIVGICSLVGIVGLVAAAIFWYKYVYNFSF